MTSTKTDRLHILPKTVKVDNIGLPPTTITIRFRIDGREPEGWYVDRFDTGWESVYNTAGQPRVFPTRRAAERALSTYVRALRAARRRWVSSEGLLDGEAVALAA